MPAGTLPEPDDEPVAATGENSTLIAIKNRRLRPGSKRRRLLSAIGIGVLVIFAIGFAVWAARGGSAKAAKYSTAEVTKDTIVVTVSASGNMIVKGKQSVTPEVSGTIEKLYVKLGQHVKAGQTLYTLSNPDLDTAAIKARSSYRGAQQALARAEIALEQAKQSRDKLDSATGKQAPTETDIDIANRQIHAADLGVSSAQDDLKAARSSYNNALTQADDRTVTAPIGGTITELTLEEGGSASGSGGSGSSSGSASGSSSGQSGSGSSSGSSGNSSGSSSGSLVISDLGSLIARVQVNEADLPNVKVGQRASLTFDAIDGLQLTGKVTQVAVSGTNSQGVVTYDVDILPASLDGRVRPNMTVASAITTKVRSDVLAVPNAAVKSDTNGTYVQVVGADGTAQRLDVTAGAASDTLTEISDGVSLGQKVVTADLSSSGSTTGNRGTGGLGGMGGGGGGGQRMILGGGRGGGG